MIFCKRMHGTELNRRAVECLIKAGAFDSMGVNRHSLVEAVDGIIKSVESDSAAILRDSWTCSR